MHDVFLKEMKIRAFPLKAQLSFYISRERVFTRLFILMVILFDGFSIGPKQGDIRELWRYLLTKRSQAKSSLLQLLPDVLKLLSSKNVRIFPVKGKIVKKAIVFVLCCFYYKYVCL